MTYTEPSFKVKVDIANPGQFFACCGLLELTQRLFRRAEGWFEDTLFMVCVPVLPNSDDLATLVKNLTSCEISGLTDAEREELEKLEALKRERKKQGNLLNVDQEKRRAELGRSAREGHIKIGKPFNLVLDWWNGEDDAMPKTWAGRQEIHKVARAAQDALSGIGDPATLLDHGSVLYKPKEYRTKNSDGEEKVEPFYFDARRFAHRLDAGFSLDALGMKSISFPAVELLCLIGLQRFRPLPVPEQNRSFEYWVWAEPLSAYVAAAVVSGAAQIPGRRHYRFSMRFRDDQKRYKAFSKAIQFGGES